MVKRSGVTVAGQVHEESAAMMESKFKGVRKRKWGRWVSEIRLPHSRQRIWLGSYRSPEKAARAFDAAVFCLRGPGAEFNFPDSPPEIAGAGSLTHPEIKAAAKRHANSGAEPALPDRSGSESPASSPSTSVSEASSVLTTESDLSLDPSLLDLLEGPDPGPSQPDFEMFPGIEECPGDYKGMQFPSVGSEELNFDEFFAQDNFLWSF